MLIVLAEQKYGFQKESWFDKINYFPYTLICWHSGRIFKLILLIFFTFACKKVDFKTFHLDGKKKKKIPLPTQKPSLTFPRITQTLLLHSSSLL